MPTRIDEIWCNNCTSGRTPSAFHTWYGAWSDEWRRRDAENMARIYGHFLKNQEEDGRPKNYGIEDD